MEKLLGGLQRYVDSLSSAVLRFLIHSLVVHYSASVSGLLLVHGGTVWFLIEKDSSEWTLQPSTVF
ncbi:hypothetical protein PanWU01x14_356940 [Parasponia andersonii]|uniref:Uncharacterized protein n=1 Tax=Parasponia andersonii TaxID=3476 RepID=A0A2P5A8V5_PARAD|nr:hypothetical protein PanWU01x14_356940 [Parasponia andersonii]